MNNSSDNWSRLQRAWSPPLIDRLIWSFKNPAYEWSTIIGRLAKLRALELRSTESDHVVLQALRDRRERVRSITTKLVLLNYAIMAALLLSHFGLKVGFSISGISASDLSSLRDVLLAISATLFLVETFFYLFAIAADRLLKQMIQLHDSSRDKILFFGDIDFLFFLNAPDLSPGTFAPIFTTLLIGLFGAVIALSYLGGVLIVYYICIAAAFAAPSLPNDWSVLIGYYAIAAMVLSIVGSILLTSWPYRFLRGHLTLSKRVAREKGREAADEWHKKFGGRQWRHKKLFFYLRSSPRYKEARAAKRRLAETEARERAAQQKFARQKQTQLQKDLMALARHDAARSSKEP